MRVVQMTTWPPYLLAATLIPPASSADMCRLNLEMRGTLLLWGRLSHLSVVLKGMMAVLKGWKRWYENGFI